MPRPLRLLLGVLLALFLVSGAGVIWLANRDSAPRPAPDRTPLDTLTIPPFSLVDHRGQPFSRDDLRGRITILDAVFTNCPMACPMMTARMHGLAEALADVPAVGFLSISIDAQRDTPQRLRDYRALHEITTDRWVFVTDPRGDDTLSREIFVKGLKGLLDPDPKTPIKAHDGSQMVNILHPTLFYLIDGREGDLKIVDVYPSGVDDEMMRLQRDVRALAATKPAGAAHR